MGEHLIDGEFQSDKYPTTPRGKVPLSVKDPTAQDLLWQYAQRRRVVDAGFSADLESALRSAGYVPTGMTTIEVKAPDPLWIEFVTRTTDVFMTTYSGHWLYGVELDEALGWLALDEMAYDDEGDSNSHDRAADDAVAVRAWRAGEALPKHYHRLDVALATKAWIEQVKHTGEGWYENGDGPAYDAAIQYALLGEIRYC